MTNAQTEARAIAWKHFEGILSALDKAGVVVPKELAGRTDYFAELRSLADDITTALAAKDAARDEAVFLKDCAEAALVKRESELVAKNAELAAVKENCETVCNSYADENQRLYDRAKRAESLLAEAIDLLGSSLCEMAPISAENHKRRVIEFIAARRALEEQGGENNG